MLWDILKQLLITNQHLQNLNELQWLEWIFWVLIIQLFVTLVGGIAMWCHLSYRIRIIVKESVKLTIKE